MDRLEALLLERQGRDGGWSVGPTGISDTESTAWAVQALRSESDGAGRGSRLGSVAHLAVSSGLDWLVRHQRSDGGWAWSADVPDSGWCTAPALLALAGSTSAVDSVMRGARWLLERRGRRPSPFTLLLARLLRVPRLVELDSSLHGWPWVPGSSGWVEPTAWSMLALRANSAMLPEKEVARCLGDGEAFLVDRACVDGGWNYGNRTVLGEDLRPYPDTTAVALLALASRRDHQTVRTGVSSLVRLLEGRASRMSLALGLLALTAMGVESAEVRRRLVSRLDELDSEVTTRTLSLSLLALREALPPGVLPAKDTL